MISIELIERELQNYLKIHKKGEFDDLIRYLTGLMSINTQLQKISWNLEIITKKILQKLKDRNLIKWDEDQEEFQLINAEYVKEYFVNQDDLTQHYDYFCMIDGTIKNPTRTLELKKFNEKIECSFLSELGKLKKSKSSEIQIDYEWNFNEIHIHFRLKPVHFHIEAFSEYIVSKDPFKRYINENRSLFESRKHLEKVPSQTGAYFFFICLKQILNKIDRNFVLKISSFHSMDYSGV